MQQESLTPDELESYRWIQEHQPQRCSALMVARLLSTIDQVRSDHAALEERRAEADWEARHEYS